MKKIVAQLFVVLALSAIGSSIFGEQPNILWIVTEDIGCDMGCYGTRGVHTPNLDRLAAEGTLYTRAYTTASVCSPSRSSFMTGLYPHQVFSKNMRIREPLQKKPLPEEVHVFTEYLRDAGYSVGLCGNQKRDWGFIEPKKNPYETSDWNDLTKKQPFFCQYQFYDTHRVNKRMPDGAFLPFLPCPEHPVDRSVIELHPYTPDTPEAREELGAYLENVNLLDMKIGDLLKDLKAKGLYENTIVIVMGDNGPPIFRGKGFLCERGIRMPLIVRVPKRLAPAHFVAGTRNDELVSALDMAPTSISLAGGEIPGFMVGRIFFGTDKQPEPTHLFALRDRTDMRVDRSRSVCGKQFKYVRNYIPELSYYESGHNNVAAARAGKRLFEQGQLSAAQASFYRQKPTEELYDLEKDPFELQNLVQDPACVENVAEFRVALDDWERRTEDNGEFEDPLMLREMDRLWLQRVRNRRTKAPNERGKK